MNNYYPYNQYGQNPYSTPQMQFGQMPQYPTINGKVVENEDMVKISEIPIGGFGVFPLSDYSKIIIKAYDQNGNIQYMAYKPMGVQKEKDKFDELFDRINNLDKKIDNIANFRKQKSGGEQL